MKWVGLQRWGWYLEVFFSISVGDQASFAISPIEYMRCWEEDPHLMSILTLVQHRVRYNVSRQLDKVKSDGRARHVSNSITAKR